MRLILPLNMRHGNTRHQALLFFIRGRCSSYSQLHMFKSCLITTHESTPSCQGRQIYGIPSVQTVSGPPKKVLTNPPARATVGSPGIQLIHPQHQQLLAGGCMPTSGFSGFDGFSNFYTPTRQHGIGRSGDMFHLHIYGLFPTVHEHTTRIWDAQDWAVSTHPLHAVPPFQVE